MSRETLNLIELLAYWFIKFEIRNRAFIDIILMADPLNIDKWRSDHASAAVTSILC